MRTWEGGCRLVLPGALWGPSPFRTQGLHSRDNSEHKRGWREWLWLICSRAGAPAFQPTWTGDGALPSCRRLLPGPIPPYFLVPSSLGPGSGVLYSGPAEFLLSTPTQPGKAEVLESPTLTLLPPPPPGRHSRFLMPHTMHQLVPATTKEASLPMA